MSCCGAFAMPVELSERAPERSPNPSRRLTGRQVLFGLLAFFGVVMAVNGTMLVLAIRTMPGVEVRSAYEASQRFNGELAARERQAALGWQASLHLSDAARGGAFQLTIEDATGRPVEGLEGDVRFERPAAAGNDIARTLLPAGNGRYRAEMPALAPGQWELRLDLRQGGERVYRLSRRFEVRKGT